MDFKNIDRSWAVRWSIFLITGFVILSIVFQAGESVGYRKAAFSFHAGDNYYQAFKGRPPMMMGIDNDDLPTSYGAAGKILKVNLPEIIIADRGNVEKTIVITNDTIIKRFRGDASSSDIKQDDYAVVVGTPNSKSQVEAKFIRLMPPPPNATSTKQ